MMGSRRRGLLLASFLCCIFFLSHLLLSLFFHSLFSSFYFFLILSLSRHREGENAQPCGKDEKSMAGLASDDARSGGVGHGLGAQRAELRHLSLIKSFKAHGGCAGAGEVLQLVVGLQFG